MKKRIKIYIILFELIILFILSLFLFFNTFTFFFIIISDSMNPVIHKNDIILVKNKRIDDYSGKVIAFYNPIQSKIIVHRVLSHNNGYLVTKGDNSSYVDNYLPTIDNVIGEVFFIIPTSSFLKF